MAALSVSCAKEQAQAPEIQDGLVERTFTSGSTALTKTSLDANLDIIWSMEDKIGIYATGTSAPQPFAVKSLDNGGRLAEFSGLTEDSAEYIAVYPYNETFTLAESAAEITMTLPPSQAAVAGGFDPSANLAVSRTTGTYLLFRNVGALLKIKLGNDGIKSITVTGKGTSDVLAGQAVVSVGEAPAVESVVSGSTSVELTGDFINGKSYYFVIYPGKFESGLSLSLTNSDGVTVTLSNDTALEVLRNEVIDLGTVTVPADRWIQSYVLNGHSEVRAFVDAERTSKETVRDLTIRGNDVTENDVRDIDNRVERIIGTLTLENLGTSDSWISTNEVMEYISVEGGIVLKDIPAHINPNGFENMTRINGDLRVINCPGLRCTDGWMPFASVTEVTGDVQISGQKEFSAAFLNKLEKIGGSFIIDKCNPSCWDWKSETLREIGGDLNITDCTLWENFYGFHQLTKLGGNVNVYKSERYAQDGDGNDKWFWQTDWNLSDKKVGLVLFTVLKKEGVFNGAFTSYIWRAADKGNTFPYDLNWYNDKADEIIASK